MSPSLLGIRYSLFDIACRATLAQRTGSAIVESDEFKTFLKANGYTSDPKIGDDMKQELAGYDAKFRDVIKFLDDDK